MSLCGQAQLAAAKDSADGQTVLSESQPVELQTVDPGILAGNDAVNAMVEQDESLREKRRMLEQRLKDRQARLGGGWFGGNQATDGAPT